MYAHRSVIQVHINVIALGISYSLSQKDEVQ